MKRERHLDRDRGWGPGHWASTERLCRGARRNSPANLPNCLYGQQL